MQSVFLQKRHLETADLYEPPLDPWHRCGGAVVYEKEVEEVVEFANKMAIQ